MKSATCVVLFAVMVATAGAATPDAPIVYKRTPDVCYRGPSIAVASTGFVALAQRRRGIEGRQLCSDDGTIDLVVKTSPDGVLWSPEHVVVDAGAFAEATANPTSSIHDPDFLPVEPDRRLVRLGSQSMVQVDGELLVLFVARYNVTGVCEKGRTCVNSTENVLAGKAKARIFLTRSRDGGVTWTPPQRVHSAIYNTCIDRSVGDPGLANALRPLFADDAVQDRADAGAHVAIMPLLSRGRLTDEKVETVATRLGVGGDAIRANAAALRRLFTPGRRIGPGNAIAFPFGEATRIVFPSAPIGVYSDDNARSFTCSDTALIQQGSERQVAWLGGDLLLMTLRRSRDKDERTRLFSTSRDGGDTWSADEPVEIDGRTLMPDAIAQASIAGIPGASPPMAIHINLANRTAGATRVRKTSVLSDERQNLAAVRIFVGPDGVTPASVDGCAYAAPSTETAYLPIWPGSAAYSAAIHLPERDAVGVLFEASDDEGPITDYRAWNEAIRFAVIDLAKIGGAEPGSAACGTPTPTQD